MAKIYINNVLQRVEILPNNTPTLDETLETFSFALVSNSNPLPLAPMQKVKVDFKGDGSEIVYFYIVSDSVETYSLKPLRYKHNVTAIQNTRILSKHLVRNSAFSQPFYTYKSSYNTEKRYNGAMSEGPRWHDEDLRGSSYYVHTLNDASQKLELNEKETVTKAIFKLSLQYGTGPGWSNVNSGSLITDSKNIDDISSHLNPSYRGLTIVEHFTLKYTDANNVEHTQTITPSTFNVEHFNFNGEYEFPLIIELAKQGCNNFEVLFDEQEMINFTSGTIDSGNPGLLWWSIQVSITVNAYYYTCYDILDILLKRQRKQTSLRPDDAPLFALPQSGDLYDLLKNTVAPNFTFTQLTMYECVAEIFRLFDAIFTMDENGVLGIDYFNDLSKENISGDKFVGRTLSLSEDRFTNGLVAHYQDARIVESFPRKETDFAHLRSVEFGVPSSQDHNLITPHNIDLVLKCEILAENVDFGYMTDRGLVDKNFYGTMVIDVTHYVLERTTWSILSSSSMYNSDYVNGTLKKTNTVFYAKGDNKIQVGASFKDGWGMSKYVLQAMVDTEFMRIFGMRDHERAHLLDSTALRGTWRNIKMRVTYLATVDGKIETHSLTYKYPGETLVDQANGAVDLNKFGLNMLGLSLKMGNPTLNATHKITRWENRVRTGQIYEWQGSLWVANVVSYTLMGGYIQGKVSFVQNFNALSLRTQLLREKRMSNISQELVQKSEEILTDFVYFSTNDSFYNNSSLEGEELHFNLERLEWLMRASFDVNLSAAYYEGLKIGDAFIHFNEVEDSHLKMIYIPMVRYGAGNTINFEMSFEHPMNAGNKTVYEDSRYFTDAVLYTDDEGYMEEVNIKVPLLTDEYTQTFPIVTAIQNIGDVFSINNFKVYKQPNEIFALNYQLAFLPYIGREQIDFLGSRFINNNAFVEDLAKGNVIRYICFLGEKSSILDTKVDSYLVRKSITDVNISGIYQRRDKFSLIFNFDALTSVEKSRGPFKSWAIVDENSNILFASNSATDLNATQKQIYFLTKLYRLR